MRVFFLVLINIVCMYSFLWCSFIAKNCQKWIFMGMFYFQNTLPKIPWHGIFCIIWRHIKVFTKCFRGKSVYSVIWWDIGKEKPSRFLKTVIPCEEFLGTFSFCCHMISVRTCFFVDLFNISVLFFSILLFLCNAIFSFSFKHSEHLLLLALYVWCRPKISCYVCAALIDFSYPK